MLSNKFAFAALGAACIAAAGVGGYFASRQNATPSAPIATTTPGAVSNPSFPTATAERPVQETEAIVGDIRPAPAPVGATQPSRPVTAPVSGSTRRADAPVRNTTPNTPAPARRPTESAPPPTLERSWPSGAATSAPVATATPPETPFQPPAEERAAPEPPPAPEPPQKTFEELVVSADSVLGLQTETPVSSDRARVEDRVEARVTRDVKVGDKVAIPAGAHAVGTVTLVEKGGKFKERARLGIRFHTIVLADGTRLPISTDTIYRDGAAPGNESAAKIGGAAVGGAILGAIIGGAKGAAIGGMTGAGAGTAVVAAGDRNAATLPPGTNLTVRILSPVTVTQEK